MYVSFLVLVVNVITYVWFSSGLGLQGAGYAYLTTAFLQLGFILLLTFFIIRKKSALPEATF